MLRTCNWPPTSWPSALHAVLAGVLTCCPASWPSALHAVMIEPFLAAWRHGPVPCSLCWPSPALLADIMVQSPARSADPVLPCWPTSWPSALHDLLTESCLAGRCHGPVPCTLCWPSPALLADVMAQCPARFADRVLPCWPASLASIIKWKCVSIISEVWMLPVLWNKRIFLKSSYIYSLVLIFSFIDFFINGLCKGRLR